MEFSELQSRLKATSSPTSPLLLRVTLLMHLRWQILLCTQSILVQYCCIMRSIFICLVPRFMVCLFVGL